MEWLWSFVAEFTSKAMENNKCDCFWEWHDYEAKKQHNQGFSSSIEKRSKFFFSSELHLYIWLINLNNYLICHCYIHWMRISNSNIGNRFTQYFLTYLVSWILYVKVVSTTFLLVCFFMSKREHLRNLGKCFFKFYSKSSFHSRKLNFRILEIQISWRHQMPKHKRRNTFYWIN